MQMLSCNEAGNNLSSVLNSALFEEVIINDGLNMFKILPLGTGPRHSPLEGVKCLNANISTQELVQAVRECRAGV